MDSLFGWVTSELFLRDILDRTPNPQASLRVPESFFEAYAIAYDMASERRRGDDWDELWVTTRDALEGTPWIEYVPAVRGAALAAMTHDLVGINGYELEHFFSLLRPLIDLFNHSS
jgi:hypothetical protein